MLLRSSSTPVLSSLVPSFSESPNHNSNHHHHEVKPNTHLHQSNTKLSIHQSSPLFSANSSPIDSERYSYKGFRRAQSDGNLAGLLAHNASSHNVPEEDQRISSNSHFPNTNNAFTRRPKCLMLESIPSFSVYGSRYDEEEESDIEGCEEQERNRVVVKSDGHGFDFEDRVKSMSVTKDVSMKNDDLKVGFGLKNGIGIEDRNGGIGGGGNFNSFSSGDGREDNRGIEEYYKRMVEGNPGNSLFLGNYARFLSQSKGDMEGAEEYYSRAILADPNDGGVLSQYANLVWEIHRDHGRATSYFERAVQASPQDSHVQAAYAHFLWDAEDDESVETGREDGLYALPNVLMASVTTD